MYVNLPLSKSIVNRYLILLALDGIKAPLFLSPNLPEDVRTLAAALMRKPYGTFFLDNSGTSMRFLTAYFAQRVGANVILDGCERMRHRPIKQEVDALRSLGANITYLAEEGFPPLKIKGKKLANKVIEMRNLQSTQFASALLLIGKDVATDHSPYLDMTRNIIKRYEQHKHFLQQSLTAKEYRKKGKEFILKEIHTDIELDWSSASYFYELVALGRQEFVRFSNSLNSLPLKSLQGDSICAQLFKPLGLTTKELDNELYVYKDNNAPVNLHPTFDLTLTPDLYPALAVTCHQLGITPKWTLPESLHWKESDRLTALDTIFQITDTHPRNTLPPLPTYNDHRIAMALLAAGYEVEETDSIAKSFPNFLNELHHHPTASNVYSPKV